MKHNQKSLVEHNKPVQRLLTTVVTPTNNVTPKPAAKDDEVRILINGNGFGGIAVGFLFFFIALMGFLATMALFVNTKLLSNPLLLGKVEA